ncbi:MAG: lipoate--protein ligase family protein [Rhodopirellula sp.]|uniref:Biotin/lipoate A/B protein ligase n=1 Tax=Rhodopirellula europaea SH398 TaxID=1263868 RepID=M5S2E5_9BACT|nr:MULTISPECIES: lipoate--protein ligase family protein [Rhodopirellula]EMI25720.1 biotin/lipoate A/B protein ligase [Rhodopirellula europaea SH398]MAP09514.1 lipoate--protein ligase family protein [Rhodopirellula sp.]MCR9207850.1 lipoate--protein ligase family protein [bacterium]
MSEVPAIRGRLIELASHDAAANMAIDEALLSSVAAGAPPTLRFYGWKRPTLSLGYFQPLAEAMAWAERTGVSLGNTGEVDLVRRSTGGGAILHHAELTLSLTLPMNVSDTGAREATYRNVHEAIASELKVMGVDAKPFRTLGTGAVTRMSYDSSGASSAGKRDEPFLCFQRRTDEDLIVSGYKVLGSAQRRTKGALLQHGSLLWSVSPHADVLPGIQQLAGRRLEMDQLVHGLQRRLKAMFEIDWQLGALESNEIKAAKQIVTQRYGNSDWTSKR